MRPAEPTGSNGLDLFVSYSRRDGGFVRELQEALVDRGRRCWVDWRDIRPTADWMAEVRAAIDEAQTFAFVISPDSIKSGICMEELEHAAAGGKRIVPLLHRAVEDKLVPEPARARQWVPFRADDDFAKSLETLLHALDTDPEWARLHTRLLVRATEWDSGGRDPSLALRGRDLKAAERWLTEADDRKDPQPTRLHSEYIVASRQLAIRGQRVRVVLLSVGFVIAAGLAILALVQRNRAEDEANVARSRERAAAALLALSSDPKRGLALAIESGRVAQTNEATRAIRGALESSYPRKTIDARSGALNDVSISPDGSRLTTAGDSGRVGIWNLRTGAELLRIRTSGGLALSARFSPTQNVVATATGRGDVELWRLRDGALLRRFDGHEGKVRTIAFSPAGDRIASAGSDGTARVWDVATGVELASFKTPHDGPFVNSVAFSPDGDRVVSALPNGTAWVWTASSGRRERTLRLAGRADASAWNSAAFSPDGSQIVTAGDDGLARVWDLRTGQLVLSISVSDDLVYDAAFSPSGNRLITASLDGTVRVWPAPEAASITVRSEPAILSEPAAELVADAGDVERAAFAPSGRIVVSAHADGSARVWSALGNDTIRVFRAHDRGVAGAAFSPDGTSAAIGGGDGAVIIWDPASGSKLDELVGHEDIVWDVAFSADGERLASASDDGTVRIWDLSSRREIEKFDAGREEAYAVAFSPDGDDVVFGGPAGGFRWREGQERPSRIIGALTDVLSLAYDEAGDRIVSAMADGTARIWDASNGDALKTLEGHVDEVNDASFSPDASLVVTAGADGTARVWDSATGEQIVELRGHTADVNSAEFSPDGDRIVTASTDLTVRVWDAASGTQLDLLLGPSELVSRAVFNPDGKSILAVSYDNTARILTCRLCLPFEGLIDHASAVQRTLAPVNQGSRAPGDADSAR